MSFNPPTQRPETAHHARSASAAPSTTTTTGSSSSAPASLAARTPLGPARTLRPSHSNGQLAREFQDKHSSTYAHLYTSGQGKENLQGVQQREKLELEARAMQAERAAARERKEAYLKITAGHAGGIGKENEDEAKPEARKGAWRPLSLVAKRQAALGHVRSASASTAAPSAEASTSAITGIRSVSHTPSSSLGGAPRHAAIDKLRAYGARSASPIEPRARRPLSMSLPPSQQPNLEVVIEGEVYSDDRIEEMQSELSFSPSSRGSACGNGNQHRRVSYPASEYSRAGSTSRAANTSTYSWATSFSGETAELRAAAHYVGSDDHGRSSTESTPSRSSVSAAVRASLPADMMSAEGRSDTPTKVKQRRKRIVTLAHTVRQLEGVGSREPEDPDFYEKLVRAWNERPGVVPVPLPSQGLPKPILQKARGDREDAMRALTDAPPTFGGGAYEATPAMTEPSPAIGVRSPHEQQEVYTPNVSQAGVASTSYAYGHGYGYGYDDDYEQAPPHGAAAVHPADRMSRATRSTRYSYASTLHDLALEGGYVQGDRLMADKPWMRSEDGGYTDSQLAHGVTSRFGAGLGDAFGMAPPAFGGHGRGAGTGLRADGAFSPIDPGTPCRLNDEEQDPMSSTPLHSDSLRPGLSCPPSGGSSTNRNSFDKLQAGIATSAWLKPSKSPLAATAASTTASTPTRPLRRVEGQVLRYGQPASAASSGLVSPVRARMELNELPPPLPPRPTAQQMAQDDRQGQGWGLGFMSTWWNDRQSGHHDVGTADLGSHSRLQPSLLAADAEAEQKQGQEQEFEAEEQGFHEGKDGIRSSRRTEMDWQSWTKGSSAYGGASGRSAAIRGVRSSGDISTVSVPRHPATVQAIPMASSTGHQQQGQTRVLVQGRKRPRGSSWSSGSRSRALSASDRDRQAHVQAPPSSFPYPLFNNTTFGERVATPPTELEGQMEWLGASGVHISTSRAQTPNSFMTRHSRHSRHSRTSRLSGAQTATTASPMYSYPVSSDSSFSATYPRVLGSGVRAHQRAFSTGSIVHPPAHLQPQWDEAPDIPLPLLPSQVQATTQVALPVWPRPIDFTRTPSDLEIQHTEYLTGRAVTSTDPTEEGVTPSTSAGTDHTTLHTAAAVPTSTGTPMGEGEREFPFSSLCRRPSSSTHSHTSFPPPLLQHRQEPLPEQPLWPVQAHHDHSHSAEQYQEVQDQKRPAPSRINSRLAHEQAQVRRAAELGLGPPPMLSSTVRWMPDTRAEMDMMQDTQLLSQNLHPQNHRLQQEQHQGVQAGRSAYPAGEAVSAAEREPRAKEPLVGRPEAETAQGKEDKERVKDRAGGLRGWASSLFPSRQVEMAASAVPASAPGAASSISMTSQQQHKEQQHHQQDRYPPTMRPRLSSRPQLSTLRQRPSLTIRLPDAPVQPASQGVQGKKFIKRKSVSPMRRVEGAEGVEVDAAMRVQVESAPVTALSPDMEMRWGKGQETPQLLAPAAALTLSRSHSQAASERSDIKSSGPPTATHSGCSHDEMFLPPPTTPNTPATPATPAASSYSMFLGIPLSPLPTPPLPSTMGSSIAQNAAGYTGEVGAETGAIGRNEQSQSESQVPSVWMASKSSIPPRPLLSTLPLHPQPLTEQVYAEVEGQGGPSVQLPLRQPTNRPHEMAMGEGEWYPTTRLPLHSALAAPTSQPQQHHTRTRPDCAGSSFPIGYTDADDTLYSPARAAGVEEAGMYGGASRPSDRMLNETYSRTGAAPTAMTGMAALSPATRKPAAHPEIAIASPARRSNLPATFFWLGIIMPWFWLIAGWGLSSSSSQSVESAQEMDLEKRAGAGVASTFVPTRTDTPANTVTRQRGWLYHPDPWCRRSRVAAATVLPGVAVAAVIGVVVLAVLR